MSKLPTSGVAAGRTWSASHPTALAHLGRGIWDMTKLFPYFEDDAYTLQPVFVAGYGTVGVTKRRVLIMDPDVVLKWTREAFGTVLAHELGHLFNDDHAWMVLPGVDFRTANVAADMAINDDLFDVKGTQWPWPPCMPADAKFPNHQTGIWYYDELMKLGGAAKVKAPGQPSGGKGGSDPGGGGMQSPDALIGDGFDDLRDALDEALGRSDSQLVADRLATASAMEACEAKGRGSVPSEWLRQAQALHRPPVCDWRTSVPRVVRGALLKRPGAYHVTYARPSRRQAALGYGVGRPVLSNSYDTQPVVWLGIDTSGSMSTEQLSEGITEIRHVLKAMGCQMRFFVIDADIHKDVIVDERTDLATLLVGGGGTSFIPLFDMALKEKRKPDLLFFYTDGDGSAPELDPGIPTIWMLTPNGRKPSTWGKVVRIAPKGTPTPIED